MFTKYIPEFQKSLEAVLRIDPSLRPIVESNTFHAFLAPKPVLQSSFEYLVRNIISQQVSGAAGQAILNRFLSLCSPENKQFPTPTTLLKFSVEELRGAGLSVRKAEYVRGLAEAYLRNELSDEILQSANDDDVVDKIVSIRGLGPWTAEMFLIFYLHRPDIFSLGDLGIQRGMRRYLKDRPHILKEVGSQQTHSAPASPGKSKKARAKAPIPVDLVHMEKVAARFSPHRTAFQLILWRLSDIQMNTIEARDNVAAETAAAVRTTSPSVTTSQKVSVEESPKKPTRQPRRRSKKSIEDSATENVASEEVLKPQRRKRQKTETK